MSSPIRQSPRSTTVTAMAAGALLVLTAVTGCGSPDRLEGTVVAIDDTGKNDRPLEGGWVAVLTEDALRDFLGNAGIHVPLEGDRPYVVGRVRHEDVTGAGGELAKVDNDGHFTLVSTGPRTVCRLTEAPQVDVLRGCAVVDLPAKGDLRVSVGEAGLRASLEG